jgi:hypothetical protein
MTLASSLERLAQHPQSSHPTNFSRLKLVNTDSRSFLGEIMLGGLYKFPEISLFPADSFILSLTRQGIYKGRKEAKPYPGLKRLEKPYLSLNTNPKNFF